MKNECECTLANNTITFKDGYVSVYGRIIYIEDQTSVLVSPDSDKYGYVILGINTSNNDVSIYLNEKIGSYPTLTKTNLLTTPGLYEFVICTYSKTTTSVTLNSTNYRSMIKCDKDRVSDLESEFKNKYLPKRLQITKMNPGVYQFRETSSVELSESIIYVTISNSVLISFPGAAMFIFVGSNTSISYGYGGSDYSLGLVYEEETVTLTAGNTYHNITSVFLKR